MANKHNNLKRIVHRCLEEVKASCDVAKVISVKAAVITFRAKIDIQIMNRNGFKEPESVKNRLMRKHQIMIDFLEDKFKEFWGGTIYRSHCLTAMRGSATRFGFAGGKA